MRGLLIKDLQLMKMQKRFFLVVVLMALFLSFSSENTVFMIGYLSFLMPSFALSTISYDEFDNGSAFLFTLPVSRKMYVLEKFYFGLLLEAGSCILGFVLSAVMGSIQGGVSLPELLLAVLMILPAMAAFLSVMIPLQLKFGAEKGRIVMILVGGIAVVAVLGAVKLLEHLGMDVVAVLEQLVIGAPWVLAAAALVFAFAVLAIGIKSGIRIMEKKEF